MTTGSYIPVGVGDYLGAYIGGSHKRGSIGAYKRRHIIGGVIGIQGDDTGEKG